MIVILQFNCYYTNIKILLDTAKNIEDMKKDIVVNFSKQEKFAISKSNKKSRKSIGKSAREFIRLIESANKFTDIRKKLYRS